jgi:hypothetical protein
MNAKIAAITDYFEFEQSVRSAIVTDKFPPKKRDALVEIVGNKFHRMARVCGVNSIVHLDPDLLDAAADLIERRKHDRKLSMERKQRRIQRNREYSADLQLAGLI